MKKSISILTLFILFFTSCKKSVVSNITTPAVAVVSEEKAKNNIGTKNKITIDFTAISDQIAIVTITGTAGEGSFVFYSADGNIQTAEIPKKSTYTVKWEYYSVIPVECNYMLYWNYTGISIYGTYPYSFISTCCVTFENKAVLTFYKNC